MFDGYRKIGVLPDDLVELNETIFTKFYSIPTIKKMQVVCVTLKDIPACMELVFSPNDLRSNRRELMQN